jgi:hypothetical protein
MPKRILFSEGVRDTEFLDALLETHDSDFQIDRLDIEEKPPDRTVDQETNRIARFDSAWNDTEVLLKSEGGIQKLLSGIPRLLLDLRRRSVEFYFLIDLDDRDLDWFTEAVNERLVNIGGNPMEIDPVGNTEQHHYLVRQRYAFVVDGTTRCEFGVAAFRDSLESVAEIDKDCDSGAKKDQKARRLATDQRVSNPVLATFL